MIIYDDTSFDKPVYIFFFGIYMYGPTENLNDLLHQIYNEFEFDTHLAM